MSLVTDSSGSRTRRGRHAIVVVIVIAALGVAAVTIAVLRAGRPAPACSATTSPLGDLATQQAAPRLCQLGAPSQLIGFGRANGVSWRVVVTPPEPWDKLKAAGLDQKVAGFDPFAVMAGDLGYCVIEVFSVPRYSFSVACGTWQQPGVVPAHTIDGGCSNGDFVLCYASTAAHTDHFVVLPKGEGERTFRAVPSRGFSYTAFTLPAGQTPILITAYDAHGRQIASTTSL